MTRLRLVPRFVRSLRKRYIRLVHGDDYFITNYFGARFLVHWRDMVAREIALRNFERTQLALMTQACARLRPELFIDVGANGGVYSCVLLRRKLVQRAILFEPDRRNLAHLRANLLINNLTGLADCREAAVGAAQGRVRLIPGPDSNTGRSQIAGDGPGGYEVGVIRLDDVVALSGQTIAVKMDIEGYELQALAGMGRTLQENRGIVQIETTTTRADVVRIMRGFGYEQIAGFYFELLFEKL
jgi:FkbM family methyltransferase